MNRLKSNSFLALLDQGLYSGANFILNLILAHRLGLSEYGAYSALVLLSFLAIALLNALFIQPMQTLRISQKNKAGYFAGIHLLQLLGQFFISPLLYFFYQLELGVESIGWIEFVLCLNGLLAHDYLRKFLLMESRIKESLLLDALVFLGLILLGLFTTNLSDYIQKSATLLSALPLLIMVIVFNILRKGHKITLLKAHFKSAKWLSLSSGVQWFSGHLFVLFSGVLLGTESLGAFRFIQSLFGVMNVFFQFLENYVLPKAKEQLSISVQHAHRFLIRFFKLSIYLYLPVALIFSIGSKWLLGFIGGGMYLSYQYLLLGMLVLYFFILLSYPLRLSIRIHGLERSFFEAYLINLIFSALSFHLLLSTWGVMGALIGLGISQLVLSVYWLYTLNHKKVLLWKSYI